MGKQSNQLVYSSEIKFDMENETSKPDETKALQQAHVSSSADLEDEFFDEDYDDERGYDSCTKCGRDYDEIDKEYQSCSKCGWDEDKQKWGEKREPTDEDYMNGDADILTGRWW